MLTSRRRSALSTGEPGVHAPLVLHAWMLSQYMSRTLVHTSKPPRTKHPTALSAPVMFLEEPGSPFLASGLRSWSEASSGEWSGTCRSVHTSAGGVKEACSITGAGWSCPPQQAGESPAFQSRRYGRQSSWRLQHSDSPPSSGASSPAGQHRSRTQTPGCRWGVRTAWYTATCALYLCVCKSLIVPWDAFLTPRQKNGFSLKSLCCCLTAVCDDEEESYLVTGV